MRRFSKFSQHSMTDTHRERNRKSESGGSRGKGERSILILYSQPNRCNGTSFMWNLATWRSVWSTAQARGNKRDEKDLQLWRWSMPQRSRPSLLGTHQSFLRGYSILLASVLKALSIWFPNPWKRK